jgi:thiamine-phosphate pyrophosphorylase
VRGLYAVTPERADTERLVRDVAAALDGGATTVQYRSKSPDAALRAAQARALARVFAARGGIYIVNDDAALAHAVGADGVHIGSDDGSVAQARAVVGTDRIIGVSCYGDLARAEQAVEEGADYVAFGSFHPSSSKPAARRADIGLLERARTLGVPVVAIGGIDADNAAALFAAGADAVAVISAVFGHDDAAAIRDAADAIDRQWRRARGG